MIPAKSMRVMLPSRRRLGSITRTQWDSAEICSPCMGCARGIGRVFCEG